MASSGSLSQYIQYAEHMFTTQEGHALAQEFSLRDEHVLNKNLWSRDSMPAIVRAKCKVPIADIMVSHLLTVKAVHAEDFMNAYKHQNECVKAVIKQLQQQRGAWMIPVMSTVCVDLRLTAQKADSATDAMGSVLEKATENLMACYRLCIGDSGTPEEESKIVGVLGPVNHLLRIYFRIDKYNLCQSMIRAVEPAVNNGNFTLAQLVTFKYFVGRMAMMEADFHAAEKHLTFAFKKCHSSSYKNKRIVLTYLLPVKMILGYMPPKKMVDKYNLPLFWELLCAVRDGDLKKFEVITTENRPYFCNLGLFIALENLRVVTYRNVFKKVYMSQNRASRIPISCFQAGLRVMSQEDVDASETQCLIASLIYNNKMKAYLSYQHQTVVFSTNNAFPRLSSMNYTG